VAEAYIVDAVRTPVGKRNGGLAAVHPADLGAHVIRAVVERTGIDPAAIDDVVVGCLDNIGAQAGDIARTAALAAGLPETVPGVTIDRQCGSSQQSVHFAAQAVMSATMDLVIAGGIQNMSQYPILCAFKAGEPYGANNPWTGSEGWEARYGAGLLSQFAGAEAIAEQWGLSREEMEAFALRSHERALHAIKNGHFDREVLPIAGVHHDEGPRADSSLEKLAGLNPLNPLKPGGRLTAGLSSQISDGAAALLIANERAIQTHNLKPRARIHHLTVLGADPKIMLTAPIPATQRALARAGMSIGDIDVYECNEAFASVPMAWAKELGADEDKLNPNGGAIAIGHPIGASGGRIMITLLHELERTGGRYGLQTMCEGGGQANVTIIERL
jgi:acetyl-CoA C-acetyltransferase